MIETVLVEEVLLVSASEVGTSVPDQVASVSSQFSGKAPLQGISTVVPAHTPGGVAGEVVEGRCGAVPRAGICAESGCGGRAEARAVAAAAW
jgi:hypothetical protein